MLPLGGWTHEPSALHRLRNNHQMRMAHESVHIVACPAPRAPNLDPKLAARSPAGAPAKQGALRAELCLPAQALAPRSTTPEGSLRRSPNNSRWVCAGGSICGCTKRYCFCTFEPDTGSYSVCVYLQQNKTESQILWYCCVHAPNDACYTAHLDNTSKTLAQQLVQLREQKAFAANATR